ncbi:hypothetical protein JCM21900_000900 [Sporobolomyces salmonicolor]
MFGGTQTTTTTTQQWLLDKYSRSRTRQEPSPKRQKLGEMRGGAGGKHGEGDSEATEWDHFTQPRLSLRLATTFASSPSSSESFRPQAMVLSVSFDPLYTEPTRPCQQHLLLDSLDLMSFSSPSIQAVTPSGQLPLKAVYRDSVIGFRYIHVSLGCAPSLELPQIEFKRFQAKFASTAERDRFVQAIASQVPTKPVVETSKEPKAIPQTLSKKQAQPKQGSNAQRPSQGLSRPGTHRRNHAATLLQSMPSTSDYPASSSRSNAMGSTPHRSRPAAQTGSTSFATAGPSLAIDPSPFPDRLSTLLPNLASASAHRPNPIAQSASLTLLQLSPEDFDSFLQEALLEEGFDALVDRVQATLTGGTR